MSRWWKVAALGGVLCGTGVLGSDAPSDGGAPPAGIDLVAKLKEQQEQLDKLKARLLEIDDQHWYDEAESIGVVQALARARLTDRQRRKVAVSIVREAHKNGLDPLLVVALIHTESAFDSYAVSEVGALGLMQVMPATGDFVASQRGFKLGKPTNLFDSELNVELGCAYLAQLIAEFGSVDRALVAYNAGPTTAKKILKNRACRRRFMAGYPHKVLSELKKLKSRFERQMANRDPSTQGVGPVGTAGAG